MQLVFQANNLFYGFKNYMDLQTIFYGKKKKKVLGFFRKEKLSSDMIWSYNPYQSKITLIKRQWDFT